ncbi:MAG: hypothetical protein KJZ98_02365 [Burkholderiaceae bacterium]|jgi:methylglutaconyl-CoA hydratase|nr:hypothetical protein [Burkholderiaceae bacterium]
MESPGISYALQRLVEQHAAERQSAEASEGFASFREKRAASWYPGSRPEET